MLHIRELRKKAKMTQVELSSILGVTQATLSGWETGKFQVDNASLLKLSEIFNVTADYLLGNSNSENTTADRQKGVMIPVLGIVRAGYPIYAEENIIDYEEISTRMAAAGDFFGLKVVGNSMEPRMFEGDTIIVRKQNYIESSEIAVVLVNGDEATVKKVIKNDTGLMLVPLNSNCDYEPKHYTPQQVMTLPIEILGKVVEVRGRI